MLRRARYSSVAEWPIGFRADQIPPWLVQESLFDPPTGSRVIVFTHVLELPRDLMVPDGRAAALIDDRADILDGLSDDERRYLRVDPHDRLGTRTRLIFRRRLLRTRPPGLASGRSFDDLIKPLMPRQQWKARQRTLRAFEKHGWPEWVTVVAASRWIRTDNWPAEYVRQHEVLLRELRGSLQFLNHVLLALGLIRNDPTVAPIALGDLPTMCPVIAEALVPDDHPQLGTAFWYPIHQVNRLNLQDEADDDEVLEGAVAIALGTHHGLRPFDLFLELMQRARLTAMGERNAQAVVAMGTAVEVLVAVVIRYAGSLLGDDDTRIERILETGLKNQLEHHLGRCANVSIDLSDTSTALGAWWTGGYALRNAAVHHAYEPTADEVWEAWGQINDVIATVKEGLLSRDVTSPIGDALEWGTVNDSSNADRPGEETPTS